MIVVLRRLGRLPDMLRELKRRHVFRVALGYAAASWMVLEVSAAVFPLLDIPEWTLRLLAVLLLLGFPMALVLAWAYDITPTGVQRTPPLRAESDEDDTSIAALPFVDRSAGGGYQYLGDGITDELIMGLARVPGLRVVARTSSFAVRTQTADVREIGVRLNVRYVVEGSLGVEGDRLRIHVQLVDTRTGFARWAETYDRVLADLFAAQEEVARAVVHALPHDVCPAADLDRAPVLAISTSDVAAYTSYLRGRALWNERTPASLRQAIRYFEDATARDPDFAHAHAGIADSYAILADYAILSPAESLPQARAAAARALALAPGLAETQTSAALVLQLDGDWAGAETGLRRALERSAGYAVARQRLALLLAWSGRIDESRREIETAARFDPVAPVIAVSRGWIEYYAKAYDNAAVTLQRVIADHPHFPPAYVPLGLALLKLGRTEQAVAALGTHVSLTGRTVAGTALYAYALGRAGRADEAAAELHTLQRIAHTAWVSPYYLAVAALGGDDLEQAMRLLARAATERVPQMIYVAREPLLDPLRRMAGFRELMRSTVMQIAV
jgi:TolB-like protein/Flp pilus assembly protein TadD